jgi:hypothetical protein
VTTTTESKQRIRVAVLVIGGVAVGLAVAWVLILPLTNYVAAHDVGAITGAKRAAALPTAREAVRTQLLTLGAGVFAAGALIFTARNFTLARRQFGLSQSQLELSQQSMTVAEQGQRRTLELTEQGQVTDRYTNAIGQLGSKKPDVRTGGIYALERIARDSARDRTTIIAVLVTFIREHSRERPEPPDPLSPEVRNALLPNVVPQVPESYRPAADLQAALNVVGRADLTGERLGILLDESRLFGADFSAMNVAGGTFIRAKLAYAIFLHTKADFASFAHADLTYSFFLDAKLHGAWLVEAKLTGAEFWNETDLTDADLTGADLTGVEFTDAKLTGARWPSEATVPEGWELDTNSGRLKAAATGSGPAEAN